MPPKYRPGVLHDPLHPGPWRHRFVAAHGARFHLAELGHGPLVVLLHGHHTYWWLWHQQLTHLAEHGYRAVALDLRGFGASDKPPRGYDLRTMAGDVAGVIRALGGEPATVVGIGAGRPIAHCVAATQPELTPRVIAVVAEHPRGLRAQPHEPRRHRYEASYDQHRAEVSGSPSTADLHSYRGAAALPFAARSHRGVAEWMGTHAPSRETCTYLASLRLPPRVTAVRCVIPTPEPPRVHLTLPVLGGIDVGAVRSIVRGGATLVGAQLRQVVTPLQRVQHAPPPAALVAETAPDAVTRALLHALPGPARASS